MPKEKICEFLTLQIEFIKEIAQQAGMHLHHVKPHGALYNMSAKDQELARIIARTVKDIDESLRLFGLSGSHLIMEAKTIGLKTAAEVFADRTYQEDGSLTPRSQPNALIQNVKQAVQQALQMIKEETITTVSARKIPITAETICIHGDGKHAAKFAKQIHDVLRNEGIIIRAFNPN
jgi:UPF0271 protein